MFKNLKEDAQAFIERDPAARSVLEVLLCYPGFHAVVVYRICHWLWLKNYKLFARAIAHLGRVITGIEIHPGSEIGRRLVVDHGTGVVIGETSIIGNDVTVYHDVTLGGIAPSIDSRQQAGHKRHPTLEDGCIIGSGAAILGPIIIGEGAKVGANSVVTQSVPANMTAVGVPARILMPKDKNRKNEFVAYGTHQDGPDPVLQTIEGLRNQISFITDRLKKLENQSQIKEEQSKANKSSDKDPANGNHKKAC